MTREDMINFINEKRFVHHKKKYFQTALDDAIHKSEDRNELRLDFFALTFVSYVFVDDKNEI
jgi:hypothetical protein